MSVKTRFCLRQSRKLAADRRTAWTTLKIAVLAPMPRARVRTATRVKPGLLVSIRAPKRTSCHSASSQTKGHPSPEGLPG
jgi:hypothetical protein